MSDIRKRNSYWHKAWFFYKRSFVFRDSILIKPYSCFQLHYRDKLFLKGILDVRKIRKLYLVIYSSVLEAKHLLHTQNDLYFIELDMILSRIHFLNTRYLLKKYCIVEIYRMWTDSRAYEKPIDRVIFKKENMNNFNIHQHISVVL